MFVQFICERFFSVFRVEFFDYFQEFICISLNFSDKANMNNDIALIILHPMAVVRYPDVVERGKELDMPDEGWKALTF